jgi:hypothetical protein
VETLKQAQFGICPPSGEAGNLNFFLSAMVRRLLFIVLLASYFCGHAGAQAIKSKQDSIAFKTIERYKTIEKFSQKTKFTKFLHHLIFKPVAAVAKSLTKKSRIKTPKTYRKAEGKIVRNIYVTTLDPFGYSIKDTSVHPSGFVIKMGNNLHIKTRAIVIRNLLLFKKNEPFDSLLVKETERLIRSQSYIHDVLVTTFTSSPKADSVDIYIRTIDVWTAIPSLSMSTSFVDVGMTDNNFIGLGNTFHVDTRMNSTVNDNVTHIGYIIPNIRNSYITCNLQTYFSGNNDLIKNLEFARPVYSPVGSNLEYLTLGNNYLVKSIELSRLFYSPVAKWAAGIFIGQLITNQNYIRDDSIRYLSSKTNIQDYWVARSWQLFKGYSVNARTTNFILSGRMLRVRYPDRLPEAESANVFNKENIYFAGVGITSRKYIQDKYIFNYGKVEDVPVGRAFGITVGLNVQQTNHVYLGLKVAWGNFYHFGYLSTHLEYGTFVGFKGFQQEVITGRINYFTPLFRLGDWRIRQFIRPTVIYGINRLLTDNLTFSEGMKGFESLVYPATRMMVLTLQTQSYSPWNLFGFRFGPYLFTSLGMLGNGTSGISNKKLYSVIGLGVLIKNNYLTFNAFQISLTFYPILPGRGTNIFNTNAYKTGDFGFDDFEISKPVVVDYR